MGLVLPPRAQASFDVPSPRLWEGTKAAPRQASPDTGGKLLLRASYSLPET